jgi:hypothetical protein
MIKEWLIVTLALGGCLALAVAMVIAGNHTASVVF